MLNVSAKDKGTGKENKITISGSSGLSDDEIEKMVQEAEANKEADSKAKELIETKNQADALVHSTEKLLEESGDKIEEGEKATIQSALDDLKEALKDESIEKDKLEEKIKTLTEASHKAAEQMYKDKEQSGEQPNQKAKKDDDDVIDAEVE